MVLYGIDYSQLNSVTQDDKYQMPRVEEMMERLGKAKYISKLDLAKGYYQVPGNLTNSPRQPSSHQWENFNSSGCRLGLRASHPLWRCGVKRGVCFLAHH